MAELESRQLFVARLVARSALTVAKADIEYGSTAAVL
jgi:hypothetical protein